MSDRIVWVQRTGKGSAGSDGKAGTIPLFSVHWSGGEKPWLLISRLPGYDAKRWRFISEERAWAFAERVFTSWLEQAGAISPAGEVARTFTETEG
jgi:hypothetical protein